MSKKKSTPLLDEPQIELRQYVFHSPPLPCRARIDGVWSDDCLLLAQALPNAVAKWWKVDSFIGIFYVWDESHIEVINGR